MELLSDGVEFSIQDDEILELNDWKETLNPSMGADYIAPNEALAKMLIEISDICQKHLKAMDGDEGEQERIDGVWKLIDRSLMDYDIVKLEKIRADIELRLDEHRKAWVHKSKEKLKEKYQGNKA